MFRGVLLLHRRRILLPILFVCLADGLVGVSYGASAVSSGFELWLPLSLSILVLAGASEFIFIAILSGGGSPFAGAFAGLLVNSRHLPFGVSIRQTIPDGMRGVLACHLMNDESVAFALAHKNRRLSHYAFWFCGFGILLLWPLGVLLGGLIGSSIEDPAQFGLDVMFPAVLVALTLPALKQQKLLIPASFGAAAAVIAAPFAVAGLAPLAGLLGLCVRKSGIEEKTHAE